MYSTHKETKYDTNPNYRHVIQPQNQSWISCSTRPPTWTDTCHNNNLQMLTTWAWTLPGGRHHLTLTPNPSLSYPSLHGSPLNRFNYHTLSTPTFPTSTTPYLSLCLLLFPTSVLYISRTFVDNEFNSSDILMYWALYMNLTKSTLWISQTNSGWYYLCSVVYTKNTVKYTHPR